MPRHRGLYPEKWSKPLPPHRDSLYSKAASRDALSLVPRQRDLYRPSPATNVSDPRSPDPQSEAEAIAHFFEHPAEAAGISREPNDRTSVDRSSNSRRSSKLEYPA